VVLYCIIQNMLTFKRRLDLEHSQVESMWCDCSHSPVQYNPSEHVITGDLNSIQHESLRKVISHGSIIQNMLTFKRRLDLEHSQVESMWFELKTKLSPVLININYRSERESHINYWQ
jgi:hypothetical protein